MLPIVPVTLEDHGVRLEPLVHAHAPDIVRAASDGNLWELWFTAVPEPQNVSKYIETAHEGMRAGHMLPWAVRELKTNAIVGSTRYHDIIAAASRVEIGYTWYAKSWQRSHVNTACKLLLFGHAFDTLGCGVVGLRTDNFNFRSQRAIEALGAKKDGVIRQAFARRDGSVRDSVMYSVIQSEWADVQKHLLTRLLRNATRNA